MTWKCPQCQATFKNKNQWHSCYRFPLQHHFKNKSQQLRSCYNILETTTLNWDNVYVLSLKTCIQFKSSATFLSIKVKKDYLELEFQSNHQIDDPILLKSIPISKKRFFNVVLVNQEEDIDDTLISWVKNAYSLITQQANKNKK